MKEELTTLNEAIAMKKAIKKAVDAFLSDNTFEHGDIMVGYGVMQLRTHVIARKTDDGVVEISDDKLKSGVAKNLLNPIIRHYIGSEHEIYYKSWTWYFNDGQGQSIWFTGAKNAEGFIPLSKMKG